MTRAALLLVLGVASLARGQDAGVDDSELTQLLDVSVVSGASRTSERADDAPATITVVTGEQLRTYGLRTLHEAINFLSLGMFAQDPLHAVQVGTRGVTLSGDYGNHVLVVVDGHPLNEAWDSTAYFEQGLGLPLELVDHLELIVGPGSVMYGSSAMLGVINIVTRRAKDLGRLRVTVEGQLSPAQAADGALQFDAPGLGLGGRAAILGGFETTLLGRPFELVLAGEFLRRQGQRLEYPLETGLTETDGTNTWPQRWSASGTPGTWGGQTTRWGSRVADVWLTASWGDFKLAARFANSWRESPAYDLVSAAIDFDGRGVERDTFLNVDLRWSRLITERVRLAARGYFDNYRYLASYQASSWLEFGSGDVPAGVDPSNFTFLQEIRAHSHWGGLELISTVDWLGDGRFPLQVGVDGRARAFDDSTVTATTSGTLLATDNAYAVTEWQVAAWAQQRAKLLPNLSLNVGARLDTQSAFAPNVSPRLALVWTTPWNAHLKAVGSSAFRTPSGYERFAQYEGSLVRNSSLRPEQAFTGELGYEQRFGHHRLLLVGFVSRFNRLIELLPQSDGPLMYENSGGLWNVGGQGLLEGRFGRLSYGATFTAASTWVDSGNPLTISPQWFGNARVGWEFADQGPRATLLANFSAPRLISAAGATGTDANGNTLEWTTQTSTAQAELRAVIESNVPQIPGLWVRGVVGAQLMPYSGFVVGPRQAPDETSQTPVLSPNNRAFAMVTFGWTLP